MKHYLEFIDGASCKFWEVEITDSNVNVRFGKIGTAGQSSVKSFASAADAQKEANKLMAAKIKKGYTPKDAPTDVASPPKKASAPKPKAAPMSIEMPDIKSVERGSWILMSYAKYVETYNKKPPCNGDIGCDETTVFLVNPSNAVFEGNFYTDLNKNDFGVVEDPENIQFFVDNSKIYDDANHSGIVVYVQGDMIVGGNFIDDYGQITCEVQVVVDGTLYAKNMSCDESYFYVNNTVISDIFVAVGNDGSYDGKTITAYYYYNPDHDVRAKAKATYKSDPEKLIKKKILRQDACDDDEIVNLMKKGITEIIFKEDPSAVQDYDYWLKTVGIICTKLQEVPSDMLDAKMCLAALASTTNNFNKLIKIFPKELLNSKEFWLEALIVNYGALESMPKEFLNDAAFMAESIKAKGDNYDTRFCIYWHAKAKKAINDRDLSALKVLVEQYGLNLDKLCENRKAYNIYHFYFPRSLAWRLSDTSPEYIAIWDYLCSVCDVYKYAKCHISHTALEYAVGNPHVEAKITPAHEKLFALPGWSQENYHDALKAAVRSCQIEYLEWMVKNNYGNIKADDLFIEATDRDIEQEIKLPVYRFLVEHGTPIQSAMSAIQKLVYYEQWGHSSMQIYQYFIDQGFDMSSKDSCGYGVLDQADDDTPIEVVKFMVSAGADINAPVSSPYSHGVFNSLLQRTLQLEFKDKLVSAVEECLKLGANFDFLTLDPDNKTKHIKTKGEYLKYLYEQERYNSEEMRLGFNNLCALIDKYIK